MDHLAHLNNAQNQHKTLVVKATGRYYTHEFVARQAISDLLDEIRISGWEKPEVMIADPFAGDGRMIDWLLREWQNRDLPETRWRISLWDINKEGLFEAEQKLIKLQSEGFNIDFTIKAKDTFRLAKMSVEFFDIIITNPPWEILKPDRRELAGMDDKAKAAYIGALRSYDQWLTINYELSRPKSKFAGWGTNLSRVGAEAVCSMCKKGGFVIIVLPSSFFADEQSAVLRKDLIRRNRILSVSYFPAEAMLFGKADTGSSTFLYQKGENQSEPLKLNIYDRNLNLTLSNNVLQHEVIENNFIIPFHKSAATGNILKKISAQFPDWRSLETDGELWAGREIDETRSDEWLTNETGGFLFVKGKMIDRYRQTMPSVHSVAKKGYQIPISARVEKIVWRDVSRTNQKRRMTAALVERNRIAGNSLGVVIYKSGDGDALRILLGIINSLVFEFQLRSFLSTGHISLSALRKVRLPSKTQFYRYTELLQVIVHNLQHYSSNSEMLIEALVARDVYQLTEEEFSDVIDTFEKLTQTEKERILHYFRHPVLTDMEQITA